MATGDLSDVALGFLAPASSIAPAAGDGRRESTDQRQRRAKTAGAKDPELDDSISPSNDSVHELDHMA